MVEGVTTWLSVQHPSRAAAESVRPHARTAYASGHGPGPCAGTRADQLRVGQRYL